MDVHPAKRIWTDVSGARGPGGLTRYIRYSLMMFTTSKGKEAYVKLEDEKKGTVIATYSLGRIIDINAPEAIIDREGMLHVLFMRGRGSHVYHTIRSNGVPMKPIYYRNIGGRRPSLKVLRENGEAYVIGGMEYDPTAPVKTVRDNMRQLSERPAFLSDRLNER